MAIEDAQGTLLIGFFIVSILYGITIVQVYSYYLAYREDERSLKLMVGLVFILESAHTAFCIHSIYSYLIPHFGDFKYLETIPTSCVPAYLMTVLIAGLVHSYYIKRVCIMSNRNITLMAIMFVFGFLRYGAATANAVLMFRAGRFPDAKCITCKHTIVLGISSSVILDSVCSGALIYYLWRAKSGLASSRTGDVVRRLMARNLLFIVLINIQGKLYANSFLASLNARKDMSEHLHGGFAVELSQIKFANRERCPGSTVVGTTMSARSISS
ncbi:hypothetical protein JAAARDRAFT_578478 [Jaapia argillacea MUCL 33604]|uniref:Uncharacterized protein n=1 Tax=Jaapia argillacea MUCL 33604 TaxID=933084 RepID=A0A067QCQ9_9AGAM|nr:hypothetical protein JAAARDRAFT_578478 [Jaapia argillacea MUCL 33604]